MKWKNEKRKDVIYTNLYYVVPLGNVSLTLKDIWIGAISKVYIYVMEIALFSRVRNVGASLGRVMAFQQNKL